MGTFSALDAIRARTTTWTGRQTYDLEQSLKAITTPGTSPPAGYFYVYKKSDGLWYRKNSAGVESLDGGGGGSSDHGTLTGLTDDDHPQYVFGAGRATPEQVIVATTVPGGRLIMDGSSDATNPGDTLISGVLLVDRTNGIVGVGELDPQPGAGALQVGDYIRINNAFDPNNLALRVAVVSSEAHGTEEAGCLLLLDEGTNEIVTVPCFRRAGVVPPVTGQFSFAMSWDLVGAANRPEDMFERTAGSLGTSQTGHAWTEHTGNWATDGSQAFLESLSSAMALASLAGQTADGTVECQMSVLDHSNNSDTGLMLRRGADGSCYVLIARPVAGDYRLIRWTGSGYDTGALYTISKDPQDGDVIRVQMTGNTYTVSIQAGGSGSFTTYLSNQATTAVNTSSIQHGLAGSWNTGANLTRWNNYKGANG
jgi:hypothetical protein